MSEELLHEKINNLKELIEVKLDSICKEMGGLNSTLVEHNGRLSMVERAYEQVKGAGKTISGVWGLVGGAVISVVVFLLTRHL